MSPCSKATSNALLNPPEKEGIKQFRTGFHRKSAKDAKENQGGGEMAKGYQ